jgi:excisionase family DNA binding protein
MENTVAAYSVMQIMARTGIGRDAIYREIREGRLPARKFGKRTLILASDLEAFLQSLPRMEAEHFFNRCPHLGGEAA